MNRSLTIRSSDGHTMSVQLTGDRLTLGRSSVAELSFPDDHGLSRQHLRFERVGYDWIAKDLGSKNGSLVNGTRLLGSFKLQVGDSISAGHLTIVFEDPDASPASTKIYFEEPPLEEQPETSNLGEPPPDVSPPRSAVFLVQRPRHGLDLKGTDQVFAGKSGGYRVDDVRPLEYGRVSVLLQAVNADNEAVCLKLFPLTDGSDPWRLDDFVNELVAQKKLGHEHILPILDFGIEPARSMPFLVLPLCREGNLRTRMRARSFYPVEEALAILMKIASAIDYAHSRGFIHGDIKPENILFSTDPEHPFLADFGLSRYFAIQESFSTVLPGLAGGSTAYLSPEQIEWGEQRTHSDIYSFAVLAYELLTGRLPFDARIPVFQQMRAKVSGQLIDPVVANPLLLPAVAAAVMTGLERERGKRPRTAAAYCERIARALASPPSAAVSPPQQRSRVFISYSRADTEWFNQVMVHLRSLERERQVDVWSDARLQAGDEWRQRIGEAVAEARVAVLLLSANFMASDFIACNELPTLLTRAKQDGAVILQVFVSPCRVHGELEAYQAVNAPSHTLLEMAPHERERTLLKLAEAIERVLSSNPGLQ